MDRKEFLKGCLVAGFATAIDLTTIKKVLAESGTAVANSNNMVAVMGGEPAAMLNKMFESLGGINKFVKKGQVVVLKPNAAWARTPELAANTNPELVEEMVRLCLGAGAKEVRVFDHTCDQWQSCYDKSGIKAAVEKAGGIMLPGNDESYYVNVSLPEGINMKSAKIHKAIVECDVWFNMPVLKNHGGAKMTISMKNYMGIVWDRSFMHNNNLHQCIADSCTYPKKPALHIVDAYRVMKSNGPQGKGESDVVLTKGLFASTDPVAVDTAAVKFFNQVATMDINSVSYLGFGEKLNLGTTNLDTVKIQRIKL